jgi:hypothetical protein
MNETSKIMPCEFSWVEVAAQDSNMGWDWMGSPDLMIYILNSVVFE